MPVGGDVSGDAKFILDAINGLRTEFNSRFDSLSRQVVSRDAFATEQQRVNTAAQAEHRWVEGIVKQLTDDLADERAERIRQGDGLGAKFKKAWSAARWIVGTVIAAAAVVVAVIFH